MKKLFYLLLLVYSGIFAQVSSGMEQEFDYGIKNNSSQQILTPDTLVTRGADGTYGHTSAYRLPLSTATKDSINTKIASNAGLQNAYNFEPEIVTSAIKGAVRLKRGSAADTDNILVGKNGAGTNTFTVKGNGNVEGQNATFNDVTGRSTVFANNRLQLANNAYIANGGATSGNIFKATSTGWESGIKIDYQSDLSGTYTTRSLIDKGYLDSRLGSTSTGFELLSNKSDSYTVTSSTTYASTKAVVDGLATKLNSTSFITTPTDTAFSHYFGQTASDGIIRPKTLADTRSEIVTTAAVDAAKPNIVTGTGTTNTIPKFTGANSLGNSLIYDNGTNVGIGTTSPLHKLQVNASGANNVFGLYNVSNVKMLEVNTSSGSPTLSMYKADGTSIGVFLNATANSYFNGGNVLIGTTTDDGDNKLQVNGTVSSGNTTLGTSQPTANNQLTRKDYVDTALALKANLASPTFTGTPIAPTAPAGTNTTQIATTAFVQSGLGTKIGGTGTIGYIPKWTGTDTQVNSSMQQDVNGNITVNGGAGADTFNLVKSTGASISLSGATGTTNLVKIVASNTTNPDLQLLVGGSVRQSISNSGIVKINNLSGSGDRVVSANSSGELIISSAPTAPTATAGTNTTQVATTAFVSNALSSANVVLTTGAQSISGRKTFTSDNTTAGGITVNNSKTTTSTFGDNYGISVFNTGTRGIYSETTSGAGTSIASVASSAGSTGISVQKSSTAVGIDIRELAAGATGNFIEARTFAGPNTIVYKVDNNGDLTANKIITSTTVRLKSYTVATLPAGTQGDTAFVTDAVSPTYLGTLTGGGSVVCPVFFNGTVWVSH